MAGINQGTPETAIGEPIRLGSNEEFEIEQHPISDRLIIRDTVNGKVAYVRKERGGSIGGDGVLIKALKEGKPMADDGRTYDTIQQAEREASSWVFIPPGTYNASDVKVSTNNISIVGSGYNTTINGNMSLNAENITIKSLSANSISGDGDGAHLENVNSAIRFDGSSCTAINCTIIDTGGDAIALFGSGNGRIVMGNTIQNPAGSGIIDGEDGSIIANNVIIGAGADGINTYDGGSNIIIGNRVIGSGDEGIVISESNTIVANNRVSGSTTQDIVDNGTGTLLDGNLTGVSN